MLYMISTFTPRLARTVPPCACRTRSPPLLRTSAAWGLLREECELSLHSRSFGFWGPGKFCDGPDVTCPAPCTNLHARNAYKALLLRALVSIPFPFKLGGGGGRGTGAPLQPFEKTFSLRFRPRLISGAPKAPVTDCECTRGRPSGPSFRQLRRS